MVRGLVEQEDRGSPQQQLRQLDTHAPAAGELARRTTEVLALEAQAEQRLLDVGIARLAAEDVVAVLRVVQTVQQLLVVGAFVVGALGDLARQALNLGLEAQHLVEGLGRLLDERRGVGHAHRLGQVADRTLAVDRHGTRRGLLLAGDDAQQGRLARAVLAHQTDPVLGIDQKRDIVEEGPAPVAYRKVVK